MKTVYSFYWCDEAGGCGENEGMFDTNGKMLDCWSCNDASWHDEYFNGFMEKLGINVKRPLPAKFRKQAIAQIKASFGW